MLPCRAAKPCRAISRFALLFVLLLPAACSCPGAAAVDPDAPVVVYHWVAAPGVVTHELEYVAPDGSRLGYVEYRTATPRAALVYLHGIESHAGWFAAAAEGLCRNGYDVFCLDRRGSGINRENRGFTSGHVADYETLFADVEAFVTPLSERYDRVFLIGLSWGGKLALAFALDRPCEVDGLILVTPGLVALVAPNLCERIGILLCTWFLPRTQFQTPIEPEMFTSNPAVLEQIENDPLRLRCASARFFWQSLRLDRFVADHVAQCRLPIQVFLAGRDRIIDNDAVLELLERGSRATLDVELYVDQTHSIQFDAVDRLVGDVSRWLEQRLAEAAGTRGRNPSDQ